MVNELAERPERLNPDVTAIGIQANGAKRPFKPKFGRFL
jgi:hypothetical protein